MHESHSGSSNPRRGLDRGIQGGTRGSTARRVLIEECTGIDVGCLRRLFGQTALLQASASGKPIQFEFGGRWVAIQLSAEPMPVAPSNRRTPPLRVWLACEGSGRRVRQLYTSADDSLPDLRCRHCHRLVYQSRNSSGRRWWRQFALPLKQLLQRRRRLLAGRQTTRTLAQLGQIEQQIWTIRQRAVAKTRSRHAPRPRVKRRYKNIDIVQ